MCAEGFDYRTAAGLHRDRLNEAESIRRALRARNAAKAADKHRAERDVTKTLRQRIGRQLIAIGEKMTA